MITSSFLHSFLVCAVLTTSVVLTDDANDFAKCLSHANMRQQVIDPNQPGGDTFTAFALKDAVLPGSLVYSVPTGSTKLNLSTIFWAKIVVDNQPPKAVFKIETSPEASFSKPEIVELSFMPSGNVKEGYLHFPATADIAGANFVRITMTMPEFQGVKRDWWYAQLDKVEFSN
jgi:hypothetical protein